MAAGFLLAAGMSHDVDIWYPVICFVSGSVLLAGVIEWTDMDLRRWEETADIIVRERNKARAEAASLETQLNVTRSQLNRMTRMN